MAASQASHSTAESVNMAGKTNVASSDMVGAGTTGGPFSHAKPTSQLSGPLPAPARLRSAVPSGGGRGSINPRPLIKLNISGDQELDPSFTHLYSQPKHSKNPSGLEV
jgi:hypothetical protein